jgi:formylglycine-generating enzyme required for sulfatase activity
MGENRSKFKGPNHPVDSVRWKAARKFCTKLAAKTGKPTRLPTEAEWEYACRAGATTDYYFGNDPNALGDYAWYEANSDDTTHPVGRKKHNAWGLYDMCGNVWQWCNDFYAPIDYAAGQVTDPTGPAEGTHLAYGDSHVLRGGAWHTEAGYSRSGSRGGDFPCGEGGPASWSNASRSGFRIVVSAPKAK